mmetsp:Transcript_12717/g.44540  ORF Transcript_12717/g.44540 Transcript_12717/m.44540 type:complete len:778 (-) Transcript_12717:319-2652(-)
MVAPPRSRKEAIRVLRLVLEEEADSSAGCIHGHDYRHHIKLRFGLDVLDAFLTYMGSSLRRFVDKYGHHEGVIFVDDGGAGEIRLAPSRRERRSSVAASVALGRRLRSSTDEEPVSPASAGGARGGAGGPAKKPTATETVPIVTTTLNEWDHDDESDSDDHDDSDDDVSDNDLDAGADFVVVDDSDAHAARTPASPDTWSTRQERASIKLSTKVARLFGPRPRESAADSAPIVSDQHRDEASSSGLLGHAYIDPDTDDHDKTLPVYLNTNAPFTALVIGEQGAGKSHTLNVILENSLMPMPLPVADGAGPMISLSTPMAGLMFHYDQSDGNFCEATGLVQLHKYLQSAMERATADGARTALPTTPKVVILVSPTNFRRRRTFYNGVTSGGAEPGRDDPFEVRPLLFRWSDLHASQLKKLMHVEDDGAQLYIAAMLGILRRYERDGRLPAFDAFKAEALAACSSPGQSGPLEMRLDLLDQLIAESAINKGDAAVRDEHLPLSDLVKPGTLVIADLTDPMMSRLDADGAFHVLLEQFRNLNGLNCGKIVVCDEAHKYLSKKGDGLASALVERLRLMRHEGMRVVVSTQSPTMLPSELIELTTITVMHRFHSFEWWRTLASKLAIDDGWFDRVSTLDRGLAVVFAKRARITTDSGSGGHGKLLGDVFAMQVRERITRDKGRSRMNRRRCARAPTGAATAAHAAADDGEEEKSPAPVTDGTADVSHAGVADATAAPHDADAAAAAAAVADTADAAEYVRTHPLPPPADPSAYVQRSSDDSP